MAYINGKEIILFGVYYNGEAINPSVPDVPVTPTLSAPTITLDGDILTITDESGLAEEFEILVDGEVKATVERSVK